jgi:hypothetical protein
MNHDDPIEDLIEGRAGAPLLVALARMGRARRPAMELAEALLQEAAEEDEEEVNPAMRLAAADALLSFPQEYQAPGLQLLLDNLDGITQALQIGGPGGFTLLLPDLAIPLLPDDWVDLPGVRAPPARLKARDHDGREIELLPIT